MIPQVLVTAATDPDLQHSALAVYVLLHGQLDYVEYRPIKMLWLARQTRLHRTYLTRILQTLTRLGYLAVGPKIRTGGRPALTYRLQLSPEARAALERL